MHFIDNFDNSRSMQKSEIVLMSSDATLVNHTTPLHARKNSKQYHAQPLPLPPKPKPIPLPTTTTTSKTKINTTPNHYHVIRSPNRYHATPLPSLSKAKPSPYKLIEHSMPLRSTNWPIIFSHKIKDSSNFKLNVRGTDIVTFTRAVDSLGTDTIYKLAYNSTIAANG